LKKLFSSLYQKLIVWSKHPRAVYILSLVSFTEATIFPIPPDPMLLSMGVAQPARALYFATVTAVSSIVGACFGYLLGMLLYGWLEPAIVYFGYAQSMLTVKQWFHDWGFWAIVFAGFTPIPFKIFTITAGLYKMNFLSFFFGACVGRSGRFYLLGAMLYYGGERFNRFLVKSMDWFAWVIIVGIIFYCYWTFWV